MLRAAERALQAEMALNNRGPVRIQPVFDVDAILAANALELQANAPADDVVHLIEFEARASSNFNRAHSLTRVCACLPARCQCGCPKLPPPLFSFVVPVKFTVRM